MVVAESPDPPVLAVLGATEVRAGDRVVRVAGAHPATLLGLMAMELGRVVSFDRLMQHLWGDDPPPSGRSSLYASISRLRTLLGTTPLTIAARHHGYVLDGPRRAVDAHVFADLVGEAADAASRHEWDRCHDHVREARGLWRGDPFCDALVGDAIQQEAKRLRRVLERALELDVRSHLATGAVGEAATTAAELTERDPFNESYWALRIEAERASAGVAVALVSHARYRDLLADELGIDPSERMRALHLELLRSEDAVQDHEDQDDTGQDDTGQDEEAQDPLPAADAAAQAAPVAPDRPEPVPPVGRAAELRTLRRAVDAVVDGNGHVVVVEGEAGIGKTRLAEYAADLAVSRGVHVVWARAIDGAGTPPLWMWEQVLRDLRRRDQRVPTVEALSAAAGPPGPGGHPREIAEQARFRLHEALAAQVLDAGDRAPLLVVLDDAQWADDGTLQVLGLLCTGVRGRSLGIVVTARPRHDGRSDVLGSLRAGSWLSRHVLGPFSRNDVADYLVRSGGEDLSGHGGADVLWDRSGGNPFFLAELVRGGDEGAVPTSVAELLATRLAALPSPTREVLAVAALVGRTVEPALLARVTGSSVVEIVRALEPAREEGVVVSDPASRSLAFQHDLAREAVAAMVPREEALRLHAAIADALEDPGVDDLAERLDQVADHRFKAAAGGPSLDAYAACVSAADQAADRLAWDTAARHRARAVDVMPPGAEDRRGRFAQLLRLTRERRLAGDVVGAGASLRQARDLARIIGDATLTREALVVLGDVTFWNWRQYGEVDRDTVRALEDAVAGLDDAAPPSPAERAALLGTLAVELYYDFTPERSRAVAEEAVALAEQTGDVELLGRTLNNLVIADWWPGREVQREQALDRSLAHVGTGLPPTTEAVARLHRAPLRLQDGDVIGFVEDLDRADWWARRLGRPELEGQVSSERAGLALLRGERDVAREEIERTHRSMSRTSLWGADWVRLMALVAAARVDSRLDELADHVIATAHQEADRMLRWTAVHVLSRVGATEDARSLQRRWGLTTMPSRGHWGSAFEWTQAAEVALALGTPSPRHAQEHLARIGHPLVLVGTAIAVWGPVDLLRARLAEQTGDAATARTCRDRAERVRAGVADVLGTDPQWPLDDLVR